MGVQSYRGSGAECRRGADDVQAQLFSNASASAEAEPGAGRYVVSPTPETAGIIMIS